MLEHDHQPKSLEKIDKLVAEYAEDIYTSGQPGYGVKKVVAALELEDSERLGPAAAGFRK